MGGLIGAVVGVPVPVIGSVIGGFVYRGRRIAGLRGAYLYGDYCAGWVRAAREQRPELELEGYLEDRLEHLPSVSVGHVDLLAVFG